MLMMHGLGRMMLLMRASSWFLGWLPASRPTGLKDAHDARAGANDAHDARIVLVLGMAARRPTELKDAHDARAGANDAHDARLVLVLGMAASS